ncbi:MAG: hypothetical protein HRT36_05470 [Alphaproteobacteria bacterium]|nr:hypothetical protein [Alphaproteobacteria bacterium]
MTREKHSADHKTILHFIATIRESFPRAGYIYTNGGCYRFGLILKAAFPGARLFYDELAGHVYTKIGRLYYDIFGVQRVKPSRLRDLRNRYTTKFTCHRWKLQEKENV